LERDAEDALRAQKSLDGTTLRIGASTTISTYVLPPILARFRAKFPGVRFCLWRENTRRIEERLLAFELDVALVEGPPHSPKIEPTFWRDEELVLVCAPSHPLAEQKTVSWDELRACEWLVRERGSGTREVVESALGAHALPPENALEIGGAETLKQSVAAGLGLAIVSREAASDQLALHKLVTLSLSGFTLRRLFFWLHLPGRPRSPGARAFEGMRP